MIGADVFRYISQAIGFHRLRSILTSLGIAIGVAAVVLLTSMGSGLNHYLVSEFSQFGTNNIAIQPGKHDTVGLSPGVPNTQRPLTIADAMAVAQLPGVQSVITNRLGNSEVEANDRVRTTLVLGTSPAITDYLDARLQAGQFLPDDDPLSARPLVLLGSTVYRDLFGQRNAVGERVRIAGSRFRVVGVLESKGDMLGFNVDEAVLIPASRALALYNSDSLLEIALKYDTSYSLEEVMSNIKRLMLARHGVEDFTIVSQQQMLETLDSILEVITFAVGALGGISLFVGGVGIFTVMTIAVRERTHEIGLLRSIGSTRQLVQTLFLSESVALALFGGLFGLAIGAGLIGAIALFLPGLPVRISPAYTALALAVCSIIGLVAGVAPARRAAHLNPLDALRSE